MRACRLLGADNTDRQLEAAPLAARVRLGRSGCLQNRDGSCEELEEVCVVTRDLDPVRRHPVAERAVSEFDHLGGLQAQQAEDLYGAEPLLAGARVLEGE